MYHALKVCTTLLTYCLHTGHSARRRPQLVQVTMWPHSSSTQSITASMHILHSSVSTSLLPEIKYTPYGNLQVLHVQLIIFHSLRDNWLQHLSSQWVKERSSLYQLYYRYIINLHYKRPFYYKIRDKLLSGCLIRGVTVIQCTMASAYLHPCSGFGATVSWLSLSTLASPHSLCNLRSWWTGFPSTLWLSSSLYSPPLQLYLLTSSLSLVVDLEPARPEKPC